MDLQHIFNEWAGFTQGKYASSQWMLSKWENTEGIVWPEAKIDRMLASITDGLKLKPSDSVVDLGCGGGWMMERLGAIAKDITGVDFAENMLLNSSLQCRQTNLVCGKIGELPFNNATFDCALCYFVLINIMEDAQVHGCILDIYRILKKGGRALIGQLPDAAYTKEYDRCKNDYLKYCRENFGIEESYRDTFHVPQKLFDRSALTCFLDSMGISYTVRKSFNPFYRAGQSESVDWRFDLIVVKK